MFLLSVLTHEIVFQGEAVLVSKDFSDIFPKTEAQFDGVSTGHADLLADCVDKSHFLVMSAFQREKGIDDDVIDIVAKTNIMTVPNPNANAFTTTDQLHPTVYVLSGLADLSLFFNSIMYAHATYVQDNSPDGNRLWSLCNKFIVGKQNRKYFLPCLCQDFNDRGMFDDAAMRVSHSLAFPILHEYAHKVLKHAPVDPKENMLQEFDADVKAVALFEDVRNRNVALYMALEFLKLIQLLDYLTLESTHPYCHRRLTNLYDTYKSEMMPFLDKMYRKLIERMERIHVGFDSSRGRENSRLQRLKIALFGVDFSPFPDMVDLADYESSKVQLYDLIGKYRTPSGIRIDVPTCT